MTITRNAAVAAVVTAGVAGALLVSALPAMARPGDGPGGPGGQGGPGGFSQQGPGQRPGPDGAQAQPQNPGQQQNPGQGQDSGQASGQGRGQGQGQGQGTVIVTVPDTITPGTPFTGTATATFTASQTTATPAPIQAQVESACGSLTPQVTTTATGASLSFTLTCPVGQRGPVPLTVSIIVSGRPALIGRTMLTLAAPAAVLDLSTLYSFDGAGNNLTNTSWGAAGNALIRKSASAYGDRISTPAGASRPSARLVSNSVSTQAASVLNNRGMSDFSYVWGQFLDHDINLSSTGSEKFPVAVPASDPSFDPAGTGSMTIPFSRSTSAAGTGTSSTNPRQQTGLVTAFVDGSQIYGSDTARANALRSFVGGKLKTSDGNMLPFNTAGLANANDSHFIADSKLFLAGDVRANENPDLASLQTVFMREHNRVATRVQAANPTWNDEQVYQGARQYVIAEVQAITYNEFLPSLLGRSALGGYSGYDSTVDPSMANEFAAAAFRYGHSLLDGELARLNNDGTPTAAGPITLQSAFFNTSVFNPSLANHEGDIDPFLKAAATGTAQEVDLLVVDDVRNFLFGPPGAGGLDLASLNIQRGRDHGLADYNTVRAAYGLPRVRSFDEITSDATVQSKLKSLYGTVDNIDLWVGGLAEDHAPGASVGPVFQRIIVDQFARLRAADRHWYESIFTGDELARLRSTHLSDIIARNTSLTTLQRNVFFANGASGS